MDLDKLKAEFEQKTSLFRGLEEEAIFILKDGLDKKRIKVHLLTSRIKSFLSLVDKVKRKESKKPFEEIQDIVGLRVVCLFLSDIPRIGDVIRSCFEVLSEDNKIEDYEVSSFGYLSVHFIAKMKKEFVGPRYDQIKGTPFEIQVRTIAMDAWATISHYLDYKSDQDVPSELRRDFYGLSGLFYVADTHFEMFFKASQDTRKKLKKLSQEDLLSPHQEINLDSLAAYLHKKFPDREHLDAKGVSKLVGELLEAGYTSLGEIERIVETARDAFSLYEKEHIPGDAIRYADAGVIRISFYLVDEDYRRRKSFGTFKSFEKYRKLLKQ